LFTGYNLPWWKWKFESWEQVGMIIEETSLSLLQGKLDMVEIPEKLN